MIPIAKLPPARPLIHDYLNNYEKVARFFNGNFRDLTTMRAHIEQVSARDYPREQLGSILKTQNESYGCDARTIDNINMLVQQQACAVITGQQVGLFSGPLYTIYKALTAVKLAKFLNKTGKERIVPIFWLASDDHDFAEINHFNIVNKNNQVETISYAPDSLGGKIPASNIRLTQDIIKCLQELDGATHESDFKQLVLSQLREAYTVGESISTAFARWLTQVLKKYGIIVIDASHPDLKKLASQVFLTEIEMGSPSTKQAIKSSQDLQDSGYHTQVSLHDGIMNIFYGEKERQSIHLKNDKYQIKTTQKEYTRRELFDMLDRNPHHFSPNVLLRPLYQDALLPTVAYVGGPGEISYFAQMKGIYESFGIHMPIIYPRKSFTILESKIDTVLRKYQLSLEDVWQQHEKLVDTVIQKFIPANINKSIDDTMDRLAADYLAIKEEAMAFDPNLEKTVEMSIGKINQQIEILKNKILKSAKERDVIITQQLNKASHSLYPKNNLQERVLNIMPLLFRYGHTLIDRIYDATDIDIYDHQIIKL